MGREEAGKGEGGGEWGGRRRGMWREKAGNVEG